MDELAYDALLTEAGEEKMADAMPIEAVETSVENVRPYEDYNLGDEITMILKEGIRTTSRVLEIVESWDSNGYSSTPTMG